jgi:hypothetical protein
MLKFLIVQFVKPKSKPVIRYDWSEDQVLTQMKEHMPPHTHGQLEKAWKKTLDTFKGESVNVR